MEKIKIIIEYITVSIVPIIGCIISILTYLNTRKKNDVDKKINKEVTQKNKYGNNYYQEDNRTYNINLDQLRKKQQQLTNKQQNINDISNVLSKSTYIYLLLIYFVNVASLIFPLPKLPLLSLSFIKFLLTMVYKAFIPSIVNILILLSLICLILAFKNILNTINVKNAVSVFSFIFFIITAIIYFVSKNTISNISLDTMAIFNSNNQPFTLSYFMYAMLPFFLLILTIILISITENIIKILFETEQTKPNFKLFRLSIPRIAFYILLFFLPLIIIFIEIYTQRNIN